MKKIKIFILLLLLITSNLIAGSEDVMIKSLEKDKEEFRKILSLVEKEKYDESLKALSRTIENSSNGLIVLQSKLLFATIILDYKYQDKEHAQKALGYMLPLAFSKELPEYEFIIANLYYIDEKYDAADLFLQKSCGSEKITPKLKAMCTNLIHIENNLPKSETTSGGCAEK